MSLAGWIFMLAAWAIVTALVVFSFYKVLTTQTRYE